MKSALESRSLVRLRIVAAAIAAVALTGGVVAAQNQGVPRTAWGAPDLQGVWDRRALTPFQRPRVLEGQEVFTAEEVASFEAEANAALAAIDVRVARRTAAEHNEVAENEIPMKKSDDPMYEACHDGNYALVNILAAAQEQ